jgi:thiol-disulfide isomerase/thioredoxin
MRRFVLAFLAAVTLLFGAASVAAAADREPYSPAALQAAQAAGKPVIVHVTASWCSTCAAQAPIVLALLNDPKYKDLVLFMVDFDTQKDLLRRLDVRAQSTFVAFKGTQEVGRSTGETDKAAIEALFDKTS